jgi:esterase/lipase superfamily enzyme
MNENLQQLALMNGLLTNWDGILLRMGPLSHAASNQLAEIGRALAAIQSPDELARVIDDLLDFTMDTGSNAYVRELISRFNLAGGPKLRSLVRTDTPFDEELPGEKELATRSGHTLARIVSTESDGVLTVPLFFGTNRKAQPESGFSGELVQDLTVGLAHVTIPLRKHKTGRIEKPHWWTLFPESDREHRFLNLTHVETLPPPEFCSKLESAVGAPATRELLIFLHGFNVTFEEAALRAAQISHDMAFQGVVVLFSWPSLGTCLPSAAALFPYGADEERAGASAERLAEFLRLIENGPFDRVHLMAHSMGSRVLLSGLADNSRTSALRLGHVAFVAADVYVDSFESKWLKFQSADALSATSYASKGDLALAISNRLHNANRVGLIREIPYSTTGLETIDASAVSTSFLGHGDFAEKRSLLTDIGLLLRKNLSAADRGLHPVSNKEKTYWEFPK